MFTYRSIKSTEVVPIRNGISITFLVEAPLSKTSLKGTTLKWNESLLQPIVTATGCVDNMLANSELQSQQCFFHPLATISFAATDDMLLKTSTLITNLDLL